MLPLGFLGQFGSRSPNGSALLDWHLQEMLHVNADLACRFIIIIVVAMNDADTVFQGSAMLEHVVNPLSESREVGRDARRVEGATFKRRVSPRFII